jgi:hypothetical protein
MSITGYDKIAKHRPPGRIGGPNSRSVLTSPGLRPKFTPAILVDGQLQLRQLKETDMDKFEVFDLGDVLTETKAVHHGMSGDSTTSFV